MLRTAAVTTQGRLWSPANWCYRNQMSSCMQNNQRGTETKTTKLYGTKMEAYKKQLDNRKFKYLQPRALQERVSWLSCVLQEPAKAQYFELFSRT